MGDTPGSPVHTPASPPIDVVPCQVVIMFPRPIRLGVVGGLGFAGALAQAATNVPGVQRAEAADSRSRRVVSATVYVSRDAAANAALHRELHAFAAPVCAAVELCMLGESAGIPGDITVSAATEPRCETVLHGAVFRSLS